MNMHVRFSGIIGLVLFLFGIIGGFMVGFTQPVMLGHLLFGLLLMIVWGFLVGMKNVTEAGKAVTGRRARFGANVVLYSAVFIGILAAVNWLVVRHNKRWDLTEEKIYSLSGQTVSILEGLKKPLRLISFKGISPQGEGEQELRDLFSRYSDANPAKVSTEIVDPRAKPHLVEKYEMKAGNLVYISYGEGDNAAISRINEGTEEAVTNAIVKLTRGEAKKIYFVQGHDEPSIESGQPDGLKEFGEALKDEHLSFENIILSQKGSIPDDAAAVVLASPKKMLLPEEKKLLIDYGKNGGRLLLFGDPRTTSDVKDIAKEFSITVGDDVVIDQIQRLFSAPELGAQPIATDYDSSHAITKNLTKQNISIYNIASSVTFSGESKEGATYTSLVKSSASAWGETNLAGIFESENPTAIVDASDMKGPVSLAVAYEKKLSEEKKDEEKKDEKASSDAKFEKVSRVVVFGDTDWILNANLHVYSNRDLILNAVNWLAGEEGGVSIRAGSIRASAAPIPRATFLLILASSFLVPELILLSGLYVWWHRRALSI